MKIEVLKKNIKNLIIKHTRVWIAQIPEDRWHRIHILESDIKFLKRIRANILIEFYIIAYVRENYNDIKSIEIVLKDDFPEFLHILERFLILK